MAQNIHIKYSPAFENPIGIAITIFLTFCSMFALGIGLLSFGRYGYTPPFDFYWSFWALILHWNVKIELKQVAQEWVYDIYLFNFKCFSKTFTELAFLQNGKMFNVIGTFNGLTHKTLIGGDKELTSSLPFLSIQSVQLKRAD